MGRLLRILLYIVGMALLLGVVAIVTVSLLFDPNDYREDIELAVEKKTGRELTIEGDLGLTIFPWLAVEVGKTQLGNGQGFGEEPFVSFDSARLGVKLLTALLDRNIEVSTATLDGLQVNLAINGQGRSNWQDFIDASEAMEEMPEPEETSSKATAGDLNIAGIEISNSTIRYVDAQAGSDVTLADLNIVIGTISGSDGAIHLDGFSIAALLEGATETPTTFGMNTASVDLNTESETVTLAPVELSMLGLDISAEVEPFTYAGDLAPVAAIKVDAFSLRNLMQRLDIEAPVTTDPTALGRVSIDATARISPTAIALTDLTMVLDDTTFTGELSIPQGNADTYQLDLKADTIDLDRYMAPVAEDATSDDSAAAPVEIPVEMIRLINARGSLTFAGVHLSGLQFENVELGLTTNDGALRLHPFSATLFDGRYQGDIRIDASGDTPVMSANERIEGVQLGALAMAMFEQDNISGTINGSFELSGRGADLNAIQQDLDGNISIELVDGAYEGTDIWHGLRKARAALRQEEPPEAKLPARTQFSEVSASGPVTNGVFSNDNLRVELPFMQLSGQGRVNLVEGTVNYQMEARVLDKPEFIGDDVTADELKDFTKTVIPMRVTGPLTAPSITPDVQKLLQDRVRKEIEDQIKDKLGDALGDLLKR